MPGLADSLLATVTIRSVTVETQFTPAFTYTPGPSGQAPSGGVFAGLNPLALMKPKFTVTLAGGAPIVVAPYGEPSGNFLPHALGAVAAIVAALAFWKGAKSVAKFAAFGAVGLVGMGYLANSNASQEVAQ